MSGTSNPPGPPANNFVFSPSQKRFFPVAREVALKAQGEWPSDAVAVTDAQFGEFNVPTTRHMLMMVSGQFSWIPMPDQPLPPLETQANTLMFGQVTVHSASSSALNGVYSLDAKSQNRMLGMSAAINAGLGLPARASTINWSDANGAGHTFTAAQFLALVEGVIQFITACKAAARGQSTTLPSTTIEIP